MFGSEILDIAIGVVFFYLLLSLICTALNELIAWALSLRATTLSAGIQQLLSDPAIKDWSDKLYAHPLIKGLSEKDKRPSYIPARSFSLALMDLVVEKGQPKPAATATSATGTAAVPVRAATPELRLANVKQAIANLPPESEIRRVLTTLLDETVSDVTKAREHLEKWFDDSMERVSGWYKRKAQWIILACAFVISFGFNADTILLTTTLTQDSALRDSLVAAAQETVRQSDQTNPQQPAQMISQIEGRIKQLQIPIGWGSTPPYNFPTTWSEVGRKFLGLLFTMIALSLGAPFWFDTLKKAINLRSAGRRPGETT